MNGGSNGKNRVSSSEALKLPNLLNPNHVFFEFNILSNKPSIADSLSQLLRLSHPGIYHLSSQSLFDAPIMMVADL